MKVVFWLPCMALYWTGVICSKPTGGTSQYLYFFTGFFSLLFSFFERSLGERDRLCLFRLFSCGERDRRRLLSFSRERSRWRRDLRSRERERVERRLLLSKKNYFLIFEYLEDIRKFTWFIVCHFWFWFWWNKLYWNEMNNITKCNCLFKQYGGL